MLYICIVNAISPYHKCGDKYGHSIVGVIIHDNIERWLIISRYNEKVN